MNLKIFRKGFNYSQDGPGNRLVLHLQGCNMKCPWCSNPEGVPPGGAFLVFRDRLHKDFCPSGAIADGKIDRTLCEKCESPLCIERSGKRAIRRSHEIIHVSSLIDEIEDGAPMFFDGGGVTLSGGEPTLQFDGVKTLLSVLKSRNIDTAVETNGTHPRLPELFNLVDHLIIDLKHHDAEQHLRLTGKKLSPILINLKKAMQEPRDILIRIPLIGRVNSTPEDIEPFIKRINSVRGKETGAELKIEFLPYHEYGRTKWEQCGKAYQMKNAFVEEETLLQFSNSFRERGFKVVQT